MAWGEYLHAYVLGEQRAGRGSPLQSSLPVTKKGAKWESRFAL